MRQILAVVLCVVAPCTMLALAACAPAAEEAMVEEPDTTEADLTAIQAVAEEFVGAVEANDPEAITACYGQNAILMPPNEPAVVGMEAILAWNQALAEEVTVTEAILSTEEMEVAGDWAYRRGTYSMTMTMAGEADPVTETGKFVEIWQRQADGSWKITRDLWNSDEPPAEE